MENESRAQADTDYTFDFSGDLDFCTDEETVELETTPSLSNDTCATYDSTGSDIVSDESNNTISLDKSISFDTCNSCTPVSTSLSVDSDI